MKLGDRVQLKAGEPAVTKYLRERCAGKTLIVQDRHERWQGDHHPTHRVQFGYPAVMVKVDEPGGSWMGWVGEYVLELAPAAAPEVPKC